MSASHPSWTNYNSLRHFYFFLLFALLGRARRYTEQEKRDTLLMECKMKSTFISHLNGFISKVFYLLLFCGTMNQRSMISWTTSNGERSVMNWACQICLFLFSWTRSSPGNPKNKAIVLSASSLLAFFVLPSDIPRMFLFWRRTSLI